MGYVLNTFPVMILLFVLPFLHYEFRYMFYLEYHGFIAAVFYTYIG